MAVEKEDSPSRPQGWGAKLHVRCDMGSSEPESSAMPAACSASPATNMSKASSLCWARRLAMSEDKGARMTLHDVKALVKS